ncbi:Lrp/AsnC family transcriptional regulator [Sediminispirochaeta smaragdinae]|uniref:Transcriptional regulator, AsnC family n=1 Tax=Sediminispirochaeta smaragdinae (strain DSM 11293 / JCM 15392 / SEBR 4228) TaxID=573413 RepID=E1R2Q5_SEDSS|nr:Lrp/AsnC family transcriptional regulator [Sediminispirochaeta smaragdinae]ADK80337.1 transcriptional regulator, AsnC family [Sediminispirochaeta smaragdinae DSM 11293]
MKIKDIDISILKILFEDSRTAYAEIARDLDLSRAVVTNKVNAMCEDKVINNFTIDLNYENIGQEIHVMLEIETSPQENTEIRDTIFKLRNVERIFTTSESKLFVFAYFPSMQSLNTVIQEEINQIKGIIKIKTNIVLEKRKKIPF